ncbi:DUF3325 domain-containing protein [Pseudomonas cavernae]|uniref:DUF3325 domain-containing protein n=1 Tax=Pseudomonas cavernae TaxID=2320867 RepID=A0A385YZW3_9PSED|nr:DUF3325 domain-containing protein [Pseudomonas cavernae]AYC31850.1 DUF3325 domain-containing protein [Pseudomonas cavernae]
MLWSSFTLAFMAMTQLSLAMNRHAKAAYGVAPSPRRVLLMRLLAVVCIAYALRFCVRQLGGEIGAVIWLGQLMLAGLLLVGLLAWRPRWALPLSGLLLLSGALGL